MERPAIKDKAILAYVEHIEKKLEAFEFSPYAKTYMTLLKQIESFNEQLTIKKIVKKIEGENVEMVQGFIDLFGDSNDKSFDKSWKFFGDAISLHETLDKLRAKMTPEEKSDARKLGAQATAEKYIFTDEK